MSFKLASKTIFAPLGVYHHYSTEVMMIRPHALGIRRRSSLGVCQLKLGRKGNNDGNMKVRIARIALEGLVGLASTVLNKGLLEATNELNTTAETEVQDNELIQIEPVFEFGLSPRSLDTVIRALVKRPKMKDVMEILIIEGVDNLDQQEMASFDVYISKPFGNKMVGPDYGEFVGNESDSSKGSLELCITYAVKTIGAEDLEHIAVTLVPRTGKPIIGGIRIVPKEASGNLQIQNSFTYRKDETKKFVVINLRNEFQISKTIAKDVSLILWLMSYVILLLVFKDSWEDLTRMMLQ